MRIGIACHPTVGGSGVVATELAHALAAGGDEVHLLSYAVPARWSLGGPRLFFHEVSVGQYPLFQSPPYSLALATKMVNVVRQYDLDLMHVHYAVPNAISAILARQILAPRRLPVMTTLHGTDVTLVGNDPSYLETTQFGIRESDLVTAVSQSLLQSTREQLACGEDIEVVPNFIDPARFDAAKPGLGARRWATGDERILVHVSNFRRVKRLPDVLEIFRQVDEQVPSLLLLVGEGPELAHTDQRCKELGLQGKVRFLGTVLAVEEVLAHADLFLLPSEMESFGLSALEAMACEVPVIASNAGGIPEVVIDGETGYLHPVGDTAAMARSAIVLLQNEDRRREFGVAARQRAIDEFSIGDIVGRYRQLYERLVAD